MTTQRLNIPIDTIIDDAINQCSQDFRGLRILRPEVDITFTDFVMTPDDKTALANEIKSIVSSVYQSIKGYVCQWYIDTEEVCFYLRTPADSVALESTFKDVVVYSLLSWWYEPRIGDLAVVYRDKAALQLSALISSVYPKFSKRRLRMF